MKALKDNNDSDILLESFESPLGDDESLDSDDQLNKPDPRLNTNHQDNSTADQIDRHIHNTLRSQVTSSSQQRVFTRQQAQQEQEEQEGSSNQHLDASSSSSFTRPHVDLENQDNNQGRLSKRQRVLNVFHHFVPIKQTYERINNGLATGRMQANVPGRFIGQGTDGVFRNLMAKPDVHGEQIDETNPPTYEQAAEDNSPEYWESSVISPIYDDEVFVEGLPVGNIANFVWNALVTCAFQFMGFLLCYLLHTSHAAKHGSRIGLGITFIFYGYNLIPSNFGSANKIPDKFQPKNPNNFDIDLSSAINDGGLNQYTSDLPQSNVSLGDESDAPYFAYGLISFGLLIILKGLIDYFRVKQMERAILHPPGSSTASNTNTYNANDNRSSTSISDDSDTPSNSNVEWEVPNRPNETST